mgnify:CR=1 FL=1
MKSRGFIATPMLYGLIALGAVAVALALALYINELKLDRARADLAACRERVTTLNGQIERQNEAVKSLENEAQERQKRAQEALEAARKGQAKAQGEIARLRAAKPIVKGDCPAGQAVQRVREGLK